MGCVVCSKATVFKLLPISKEILFKDYFSHLWKGRMCPERRYVEDAQAIQAIQAEDTVAFYAVLSYSIEKQHERRVLKGSHYQIVSENQQRLALQNS
jgi:hypothetical protein